MGGAGALTLVFADSPAARRIWAARCLARDADARARADLDMGVTPIDIGPASKEAGDVILDIARRKGVEAGRLDIKFGFNPFAVYAEGGPHAAVPWTVLLMLATMVADLTKAGVRSQSLVCDGRGIHAAGGSEAQELAFVLASAAACLRGLESAGLPLRLAADGALYVRLAVDADQFLSIAKLRALRRLWARLETACGLDPRPVLSLPRPRGACSMRIDPQVNILRNTVAAFAARSAAPTWSRCCPIRRRSACRTARRGGWPATRRWCSPRN